MMKYTLSSRLSTLSSKVCFQIMFQRLVVCLLVIKFVVAFKAASSKEFCCSKTSTSNYVKDDMNLTSTVTKIREGFLSKRPYFDIFDVAVVIPSKEKDVFLRGAFGGSNLTYPASMIKLIYFISAMNWCVENGKRYDCLDSHFRPLIQKDSNFECGVVVDIETETVNLPNLTSTKDPRWNGWLNKRNYTQKYFDKFDLLENQVMLTKTYPTNSKFIGAELLTWDIYGGNRLNPCCASMILFDTIYGGKLLPFNSSEYAKYLLTRKTHDDSPVGHGLPAGTVIIEKDGGAFPWQTDTAFVLLPNNKFFFVSYFSNCLKSERIWDYGLNSYFAIMLMKELGYDTDLPPQIIINPSENHEQFNPIGKWYREESVDMIGDYFYMSKGEGIVEVSPDIPETGIYEISLYVPTVSSTSNRTEIKVWSFDEDGKEIVSDLYVDQRIRATYVSIGDYKLEKGSSNKVLEIISTSDIEVNVAVDSVMLSKYP